MSLKCLVYPVKKKCKIDFRQPFIPPVDQTVCIQSHNYLTEPENPINSKVIVKVDVKKLCLNENDLHKFILLCGEKYNANEDILTLTSNNFPYSAQNVKFSLDILNNLLEEAKVYFF